MFKLLLSYVHLLATCLALGSVLTTDWRLFRGRSHALRAGAMARLMTTRRIVLGSLAVLWITGLTLIWLGYSVDPEYLANEKLWAKISVVVVLTINGIILHRVTFPKINIQTTFTQLPARTRLAVAVPGAISTVSWLFAAFLGSARPWNHSIPYTEVLMIFGAVMFAAALAAAVFSQAPVRIATSESRRRELGVSETNPNAITS